MMVVIRRILERKRSDQAPRYTLTGRFTIFRGAARPARLCDTSPPNLHVVKTFYRWTRDVHLYAGLFISPFVLVYAISAILLNHATLPWGGRAIPADTRVVRVAVTDSDNGLAVAQQVQLQVGVPGEIQYVGRKAGSPSLSFPIESPGRVTNVRVRLDSGTAVVESRRTGVWDAAITLHKMPGPHNANIRGNWVFTRLWRWLADATVYLLLFLSVSGVYLWTVLRADRRTGLVFLGAGVLSFVGLLFAMIA